MKAARIHFDDVLATPATDKRLEVLRAMHRVGSISEAARATGVSYKAAWQALETLSNLAGVPLVEKVVGGSGGGGARLTPDGVRVLQAADALHTAREQALQRIARSSRGRELNLRGLAGVGLRTSMRNQLPCTVREIRTSQGTVRVLLELPDAQLLASRITAESRQLLGLRVDMPVLALCKAAAVTVAPTIVVSAGINRLHGTVTRRSGAAGRIEVSLQLKGAAGAGLSLVGLADADHAPRLRQAAMAAIDESAVVIGIAG